MSTVSTSTICRCRLSARLLSADVDCQHVHCLQMSTVSTSTACRCRLSARPLPADVDCQHVYCLHMSTVSTSTACRCRLSACPLPVTPIMGAGNHHLRPYRGPQFTKTKIRKGKLKDVTPRRAAPRRAKHSTQSTEQFNYAL